MERVALTYHPIEERHWLEKLQRPDCGALLVFWGVARNHTEGKAVQKLFYEAYEEMAQKKLEEVRHHILQEYEIADMVVVHRLGEIAIGEASLLVAIAAPHRKPALAAMDATISRIKQNVPIWKKEYFQDSAHWVELEERES